MFTTLQTEVANYYRERSSHNDTLCSDMRDVERGDVLLADGSYGPAADAYRAALQKASNNPHALNGLSYALFQTGDTDGAIEAAQKAADAYPDDPLPLARQGLYALASDDAEMRDSAYDRFLTIVSERPPQERMALLRQAIGDLEELIGAQPELGERANEVIPLLATTLDGFDDGQDTYQYPALYSQLGRLALLAGDPTSAESLLRQSIELDDHQPLAKASLAMAVLLQDRPADAEIQGVVDELNDPLWEEVAGVEGFGRDELVELVRADIEALTASRPAFERVGGSLTDAIDASS
jgi:Flp pilus assembly protein TadD